jgi:hypothetical protein
MVFTTRLSAGAAAATASSTNCAASASPRRTASRTIPQTQGKVERFQQTLEKWLARQPPAATLTGL